MSAERVEDRLLADSLRDRVIRNYISSSVNVHKAATSDETRSFLRAYRYFLRGWLTPEVHHSWLDLGCGQGQLMLLAREYNYKRVKGIDLSAEMLANCRRENLDVLQADVFAFLLSCEDDSWDVVSAFDLVEHFSKEHGFRLLRDIHRIVRDGGICLLKLPNAYSPFGFGITSSDLTHEAAYAPATIAQLARLAGFSVAEVREVGPAPGTFKSRIRGLLWRVICACCRLADVVETGGARTPVYSRVMLVRLQK